MSQQINLFDPLFRRQKKYFSAHTMAQALGLLLTLSLILYGFAWYRVDALERHAVASAQRLKVAEEHAALAERSAPPREKSPLLAAELVQTAAKVAARERVLAVLNGGAIGNTRGYSEYFRAFARQDMEGVWLTELHIGNNANGIFINGRALEPSMVPVYVQRLQAESTLRGRYFDTLEMHAAPAQKDTHAFVEFSLGAARAAGATAAGG